MMTTIRQSRMASHVHVALTVTALCLPPGVGRRYVCADGGGQAGGAATCGDTQSRSPLGSRPSHKPTTALAGREGCGWILAFGFRVQTRELAELAPRGREHTWWDSGTRPSLATKGSAAPDSHPMAHHATCYALWRGPRPAASQPLPRACGLWLPAASLGIWIK